MQMTLKVAALKADKKLMQIASKSAALKADESGCIASKAAAPKADERMHSIKSCCDKHSSKQLPRGNERSVAESQ